MSELEYEKWLRVRTDTAVSARRFFGVPQDTPTRLDPEATLRSGERVWLVLSPAWVRQQSDRMRQ